MNEKSFPSFEINAFTLKIIAFVTMLIDHLGAVIFTDIGELRIIGRIAFPIFCFLLVEGFYHTSSRIHYLKRLFIFALISEIPFDLAFYGSVFDISHQNVFFTLVIGMIMMILCERTDLVINAVIIVTCCVILATFLCTDYSYLGVLIIAVFYFFRKNKTVCFMGQTVLNAGLQFGSTQMYAILALVPIWFYNGKKGYGKLKYFFYVCYPAHLIILFLINKLII